MFISAKDSLSKAMGEGGQSGQPAEPKKLASSSPPVTLPHYGESTSGKIATNEHFSLGSGQGSDFKVKGVGDTHTLSDGQQTVRTHHTDLSGEHDVSHTIPEVTKHVDKLHKQKYEAFEAGKDIPHPRNDVDHPLVHPRAAMQEADRHGPAQTYSKRGNLIEHGNYKNGVRDGPQHRYADAPNGQLISTTHYSDGDPVSSKQEKERLTRISERKAKKKGVGRSPNADPPTATPQYEKHYAKQDEATRRARSQKLWDFERPPPSHQDTEDLRRYRGEVPKGKKEKLEERKALRAEIKERDLKAQRKEKETNEQKYRYLRDYKGTTRKQLDIFVRRHLGGVYPSWHPEKETKKQEKSMFISAKDSLMKAASEPIVGEAEKKAGQTLIGEKAQTLAPVVRKETRAPVVRKEKPIPRLKDISQEVSSEELADLPEGKTLVRVKDKPKPRSLWERSTRAADKEMERRHKLALKYHKLKGDSKFPTKEEKEAEHWWTRGYEKKPLKAGDTESFADEEIAKLKSKPKFIVPPLEGSAGIRDRDRRLDKRIRRGDWTDKEYATLWMKHRLDAEKKGLSGAVDKKAYEAKAKKLGVPLRTYEEKVETMLSPADRYVIDKLFYPHKFKGWRAGEAEPWAPRKVTPVLARAGREQQTTKRLRDAPEGTTIIETQKRKSMFISAKDSLMKSNGGARRRRAVGLLTADPSKTIPSGHVAGTKAVSPKALELMGDTEITGRLSGFYSKDALQRYQRDGVSYKDKSGKTITIPWGPEARAKLHQMYTSRRAKGEQGVFAKRYTPVIPRSASTEVKEAAKRKTAAAWKEDPRSGPTVARQLRERQSGGGSTTSTAVKSSVPDPRRKEGFAFAHLPYGDVTDKEGKVTAGFGTLTGLSEPTQLLLRQERKKFKKTKPTATVKRKPSPDLPATETTKSMFISAKDSLMKSNGGSAKLELPSHMKKSPESMRRWLTKRGISFKEANLEELKKIYSRAWKKVFPGRKRSTMIRTPIAPERRRSSTLHSSPPRQLRRWIETAKPVKTAKTVESVKEKPTGITEHGYVPPKINIPADVERPPPLPVITKTRRLPTIPSAKPAKKQEKSMFISAKDSLMKSVLTTEDREDLKQKQFALPKKAEDKEEKGESGNYPIPDLSHARNALAMVARYGSSSEQAKVRAAVYKKYPELDKRKEEKEEMEKGSDDVMRAKREQSLQSQKDLGKSLDPALAARMNMKPMSTLGAMGSPVLGQVGFHNTTIGANFSKGHALSFDEKTLPVLKRPNR